MTVNVYEQYFEADCVANSIHRHGALVMLIGFWKTLLLVALFGIGFFLGTVENKQEFIKDTANKIIPEKEAKVIDLKSEITREQEEHAVPVMAEALKEQQTAEKEDGE